MKNPPIVLSNLIIIKKTGSEFLISFIFLFFLFNISGVKSQNLKTKEQKSTSTENNVLIEKYSYKVINSHNKSFGYDIFCNDKLLIHQTTIPGLPGNTGFKNDQDAKKIAVLVITKIKKGEIPPSVSTEELKKWKIIK